MEIIARHTKLLIPYVVIDENIVKLKTTLIILVATFKKTYARNLQYFLITRMPIYGVGYYADLAASHPNIAFFLIAPQRY